VVVKRGRPILLPPNQDVLRLIVSFTEVEADRSEANRGQTSGSGLTGEGGDIARLKKRILLSFPESGSMSSMVNFRYLDTERMSVKKWLSLAKRGWRSCLLDLRFSMTRSSHVEEKLNEEDGLKESESGPKNKIKKTE